LIIAALFDQGAFLEEGGWRGFATPLLQAGQVNPLLAALIVGAAWGMWHVPRDIVSGVADRLGLLTYLALYLPSFVLGAIAVSVLAAACSNRMGGSILPAILLHGLSNDAIGLSGVATIEAALTPAHQFSKALPMLAIACIVALTSKGTLWFDDSE
jgi:membrane protease YdiL (CAAX protease family)